MHPHGTERKQPTHSAHVHSFHSLPPSLSLLISSLLLPYLQSWQKWFIPRKLSKYLGTRENEKNLENTKLGIFWQALNSPPSTIFIIYLPLFSVSTYQQAWQGESPETLSAFPEQVQFLSQDEIITFCIYLH